MFLMFLFLFMEVVSFVTIQFVMLKFYCVLKQN